MATQTQPYILFPDPTSYPTTFTSRLIDASGEKVAFIIQVPKAGNITRVGFRTGVVTTPQTIRAGIETVDNTTGDPTGTQYGGSAVGTQTSPATNTYYEVTLATPATATRGDVIALVFQFDGTVGNLNISLASGSGPSKAGYNFPYTDHFTAAWAHQADLVPNCHIMYDDSSYPSIFVAPASGATVTGFNSNSNPDERALLFQVPWPATIVGMAVRAAGSATNANFSLILYAADGTTTLASIAVDANQLEDSAGAADIFSYHYFTASVNLTKGTNYYASLLPTTTTNINVARNTYFSSASMASISGGVNCFESTRVNAGAWTNSTTTRPQVSLILTAFDDGVAQTTGYPFVG